MHLAQPYGYPAQWGDLGGWITGVSTVALAFVTYLGLRVQRKEIRRQQGELDAQQKQINEQRQLTQQQTIWITTQLNAQRKAQARRVEAEALSVSAEMPNLGMGNYQYVRVTNKSERPIYDVSCVWLAGDHVEPPQIMGQVSKGPTNMDHPRIGVLGGMPYAMLRPSDHPLDFVFTRQPVRADLHRFEVTFTDDEEVEWRLDAQQRLTEVPPAPETEPEVETPVPEKRGWRRLLCWR